MGKKERQVQMQRPAESKAQGEKNNSTNGASLSPPALQLKGDSKGILGASSDKAASKKKGGKANPGLAGSVGKGGLNDPSDVARVQALLNANGAKLAEDGLIGPLTIAAIEAFQMSNFGWSDGKVDIGGKTWRTLESLSAKKEPLIYEVKKGDTLGKIAKLFNMSVSDILSANPSIKDPNMISIGQKITIPQGNTGGGITPKPDKDKEKDKDKKGGKEGGNGESVSLIYGSKVSTEFGKKVIDISGQIGIDPNYLMAAMAFETGGTFSPSIKNAAGSGATGLIQFMPATAKGLGTTTADLAKMTAVEQLDYVLAYFKPYSGRLSSLEDIYMAILWPRAIGKPNNYVLWSRGTKAYAQNAGLDSNKDGSVTKAEAAGKVRGRYEQGLEDIKVIGGGEDKKDDKKEDKQKEEEKKPIGAKPSSSNFSSAEFDCNDGTPVPEEFYPSLQELMDNLEVLRAELGGSSISVNSGYRTPSYNAKIGGATNSQHKLAKAADIRVSGHSPGIVHATIGRLIKEGAMKQGGLGKYNTFTHYDVRGSKARW